MEGKGKHKTARQRMVSKRALQARQQAARENEARDALLRAMRQGAGIEELVALCREDEP